MKKSVKRYVSFILVVALLCEVFPLASIATEGDPGIGVGADNSDYEINAYEQAAEEGSAFEDKVIRADTYEAEIVGEDESRRDAAVKHFRMSDGGYIAVQYDTAVHYKDENGEWTDIDNTLEWEESAEFVAMPASLNSAPTDIADTATYSAVNGDNIVAFPVQLQSGGLYAMDDGEHRIRLSLGIGNSTVAIDEEPPTEEIEQSDEAEEEPLPVETSTPEALPVSDDSPAPEDRSEPESTEAPEVDPESPVPTEVDPDNGDETERPVETETVEADPAVDGTSEESAAVLDNEAALGESVSEESTEQEEKQEENTVSDQPDEPEENISTEETIEPTEKPMSEETEQQEGTAEPEEDNQAEPEVRTFQFDINDIIQRSMDQPIEFNSVTASVTDMDILFEEALIDTEGKKDTFYEKIRPSKISSEIVYENVFEGVDLKYNLYGLNLKESIIVHEPQEKYSYIFSMDLGNLTPELDDETGKIYLMDGEEISYEMPAPYMFDATGEVSDKVVYGLAEVSDGKYIIVVMADEEWINSEERAFPVTIDPTLFERTVNTDDPVTTTHTTSGSPNATHTDYQMLYVGFSSVSSYAYCYTFLNVNTLPALPENCVITAANISLVCSYFSYISQSTVPIMAYQVTGTKPSSYSSCRDWFRYMTYNNSPSFNQTALDFQILSESSKWSYVSWDITRAAQEWYKTQNQDVCRGILLKATDLDKNVVVGFNGYGTSSPSYFWVSYRNSVGIEDYYTHQTAGADRAGTAYVNDFTSQVTVEHNDIALDTSAFSFGLSHVYNTAYAGLQFYNNEPSGLHTNVFSSYTGAGWKLSAQETILWSWINGRWYLIYNDADGTEHYMVRDTSDEPYRDEDGLGLECTYTRSSVLENMQDYDYIYTVTDKDAYTTKVFHHGYLMSVSDSNGNTIYYAYGSSYDSSDSDWKPTSANNRLYEIVGKANRTDAPYITLASFSYNSDGYLASVTDYAGRVTQYSYSSTNRLTQIRHPDGTTATYQYDGNGYMTQAYDSESSCGLRFNYTSNNVGGYTLSKLEEFSSSAGTGNGFLVVRDSARKIYYQFYGADRVANTSDDLRVYYLFDDWGRTICSYTLNNSGTTLYGASASVYTSNSGTSASNNRITDTATDGRHGQNLLKDGGLEFNSSVGAWSNYGSGGSVTGSSNGISPRLGNYMIALSGSSGGTAGMMQTVTLSQGTTYTFSGYINIKNMPTNASGGVYLAFLNSSNSVVKSSDKINYNTIAQIDNGWEKVSVTYTAASSGTYKVVMYVSSAACSVCGDDFQLEVGDAATSTNLLQGASFENNYSTTYWYSTGGTALSTADKWAGSNSMQIIGSPTTSRWIAQNVPVNKSANGLTFILSGWAKASSVPWDFNGSRRFCLVARIHYTDGTSDSTDAVVRYSAMNTDWQYGSTAVTPQSSEKTINYIEVWMAYYSNCNTAYFDDLSLVMEPAQSYSYDSEGNVVSAKDPQGKTAYEYYDGTSILKTYTDLAGVQYSMTYDGTSPGTTHNLITMSNAGVTITNGYDNAGNNTVTNTTATGTSKYLQSWSTYTNGLYQTQIEDVSGIGLRYAFNTTYHRPYASLKYGSGQWQYYTYMSNSDRLNQTYISGVTALSYLYDSGQLSGLNRKSFVGSTGMWQRYNMPHDSFGNNAAITIQRSANNSSWSSGRTLASYSYAGNDGHLNQMTYGNGDTISYSYDVFDRVTTQQYNDGTSYHYVYNAEGDLTRQYETGGHAYDFQYDSLGRLIRSKETDASGNMIQRTEHIYDIADRLKSQSWQIGSISFSESYSYDSTDGKLSSINTAANTTVTLTYDPLKRLSTETTASGSSTLYNRNYTYRDSTSTTNRTTLQVSGLNYTNAGGSTLLGYGYTYNTLGDITAEKDSSGKNIATYTYDARQQLLTEQRYDTAGNATTLYTYTYDTAGNILTASNGTTTHTYSYNDPDWVDLLTAYDGHNLTYDTIGNPLVYYNGETYIMTWEKGRRLASLRPNYTGAATITYEYDMDGILTSKTQGPMVTSYITQNGRIVRENAPYWTMDFIYDNQSRPYAFIYNNLYTYYYLLNLQGDVVGLLDGSGNIVATYAYNAWGELISITDTTTTGAGSLNPLLYRGYYYDRNSGFYYLQSRFYDPKLGRFINADGQLNSALQGSLNLFSYCWNNPVNYLDVEGDDPAAAAAWTGSMWWLTAIDGPLPIGDIIYGIGIIILSIDLSLVAENVISNAKQSPSQETGNNVAAIKSASTPANPQPPNHNNRWNNSKFSKQQSGKSLYNKNGIRVDYEYNGNRSGNVHIHYKGKKIVAVRVSETGAITSNNIPNSLAKNPQISRAILTGLNYLKQLGGW